MNLGENNSGCKFFTAISKAFVISKKYNFLFLIQKIFTGINDSTIQNYSNLIWTYDYFQNHVQKGG